MDLVFKNPDHPTHLQSLPYRVFSPESGEAWLGRKQLGRKQMDRAVQFPFENSLARQRRRGRSGFSG